MRREAAKNRSQQNPNEQELKNWGQPGRSQTAQVGTFLNLVFLLLICQIDCCKPGSSLEFTKLILWSNKHLDKERVDKPWFSRVFREVFQVREEAGQRTLSCEHQPLPGCTQGRSQLFQSLGLTIPLLSCTAEMLQQQMWAVLCARLLGCVHARQDKTEDKQGHLKKRGGGRGGNRKEWKFDYRVFIKSWCVIRCLWKLF